MHLTAYCWRIPCRPKWSGESARGGDREGRELLGAKKRASVPPIASLMPRPNVYSNQALSISTTKKQDPGPSTTLHSTLNVSSTKRVRSRFRHDTPLLVRSSVNFDGSIFLSSILKYIQNLAFFRGRRTVLLIFQRCLLRSIALHTTLDFPVKKIHTQAVAQENVSRQAIINID